ncbi:AAA family ATPase [Blastopirellula sp. JC732]|uniref:AAA family ATPase n=1 Tax=Blastopirellula sediminis TaxID=2894196 RepID=A0A9X1MND6_9BACT|nr:AAA family ATPase [Blastopirellula sediminis]MCC9607630.1 AAA family ATPase [Blastopirellula sediminis]MCC9629077.1 AAA family ATPase [Blastopirellula sediminis]
MRKARIRRLGALLRAKQKKKSKQANNTSVHEELIEAQWLACMMTYPERLSEDALPLQIFQVQYHRDIYSALLSLHITGDTDQDAQQLLADLLTYGYDKLTAPALIQAVMHSGGQIASISDYAAALRKRLTPEPVELPPDGEIVRLELGGGSSFRTLTTEELFAEQKPREWLIANFLTRNEPAVLVGPSKTLKSSLAVDLCAALASGGKFLNHFAAEKPVRVGFASSSQQQQTLSDLTQRWGEARQAAPNRNNLMWLLTTDDPADPETLGKLRDWITTHELEVVVIDAIRLSSTGKRKQAEALRTLAQCCLDNGATPILCVQTRKEMKPGKLDAAILAGSLDFAQQWLLVNRRQNYAPGSGEHRLWLTLGGYAGQGGEWGVDVDEGRLTDVGQAVPAEMDRLARRAAGTACPTTTTGRRWKTIVHDADALQDEAERWKDAAMDERMRSRIRLAMTDLGEAHATKLRVRENCGMNGTKFARAWDRMVAAGEIEKIVNEKQFYYPRYRLITPSTDEKKEASESTPTIEKNRVSGPVDPKSSTDALQNAPTGRSKRDRSIRVVHARKKSSSRFSRLVLTVHQRPVRAPLWGFGKNGRS